MSIVSMPGTTRAVETNSVWGTMVWGEFTWGTSISQYLADAPICFVVNTNSGAWAKYIGWDAQCLIVHDEQAYFGTSDGRILACELGGTDDGALYYCQYGGLFETVGSGNATKHLLQARATFTYSQDFVERVSVSTDYVQRFPASPPSIGNTGLGVGWDSATWDVTGVWDSTVRDKVKAEWVSVGETGYSVSPQVQVTCGSAATPDAELASVVMTYWDGGVVV
jgi:hypothetical protein